MDVTIARNDTYENFEAELRRNVLGITHITALPITSIIKQYREYKIPVRRMSIIAKHDSITLNVVRINQRRGGFYCSSIINMH